MGCDAVRVLISLLNCLTREHGPTNYRTCPVHEHVEWNDGSGRALAPGGGRTRPNAQSTFHWTSVRSALILFKNLSQNPQNQLHLRQHSAVHDLISFLRHLETFLDCEGNAGASNNGNGRQPSHTVSDAIAACLNALSQMAKDPENASTIMANQEFINLLARFLRLVSLINSVVYYCKRY